MGCGLQGLRLHRYPKEPRLALPWTLLQPCIPSQGNEALDATSKHGPRTEWLREESSLATPCRAGMEASAPRYHLLGLPGAPACRRLSRISEEKPRNPGHQSSS